MLKLSCNSSPKLQVYLCINSCIDVSMHHSTICLFSLSWSLLQPKKGGQCLLWHGCRFVVNRMGNGRIYWQCSKRTCSARVTTQVAWYLARGRGYNSGRGTPSTDGHNHAVDETDSRVEQLRSNLRKRAREEVVPIPLIYNDALIELSS